MTLQTQRTKASFLFAIVLALTACGKKDEAPAASAQAFPAGNAAADLARIGELKEQEAAERAADKESDKKWFEGLAKGASAPLHDYNKR